jgi:hypothetical protein
MIPEQRFQVQSCGGDPRPGRHRVAAASESDSDSEAAVAAAARRLRVRRTWSTNLSRSVLALMPRNAEGSPNTFVASPSDGCACVSACTPDGEFFALFTFAFEGGGCAVFEARVHVKHGLQRISRRGPSAVVGQEDIVSAVQWRKERLARDGIKYQQVSWDILLSSLLKNS